MESNVVDGVLTIEGTNEVNGYAGRSDIREVLIQSANRVCKRAFYGCNKLRSVKLVAVSEVLEEAFAGCGKLKSVFLGPGCTKVGEKAFSGCSKLENLSVPPTLKSIPSNAVPKQTRILHNKSSGAIL